MQFWFKYRCRLSKIQTDVVIGVSLEKLFVSGFVRMNQFTAVSQFLRADVPNR